MKRFFFNNERNNVFVFSALIHILIKIDTWYHLLLISNLIDFYLIKNFVFTLITLLGVTTILLPNYKS